MERCDHAARDHADEHERHTHVEEQRSRRGDGTERAHLESAGRAEENLRAFDLAFDDEDHQRIDALLAELPGPSGDVYSVEREPGGRHAVIMKTDLNDG